MADETYAGEFYCVKCREKREAEGNVVVSNGRRMAVGPVCGTKLNRILGKACRAPPRCAAPPSDEEAPDPAVRGFLVSSSRAVGRRLTRRRAHGSCGVGRGRA